MSRNAFQFGPFRFGLIWFGLAVMAAACPSARALEHVTLKNGFELDCVRREAVGDKVRLYLAGKEMTPAGDSNYLEVAADSVVRVETVAEAPEPVATTKVSGPLSALTAPMTSPTREEMH